MLKPIKTITWAATGMLAAALTACSDTDAPSLAGQEVWMTIDVSRRGADTDSRLTHTEVANGLDANWEPGDYIYVFDNSGSRYLGRIDWQQEVTNTSTENVATFAGKLTDVNDGKGQTFVLYYVGKDSKGTRRTLTTDHGISIDMSSQAGTFESMAWNDIMSAGPMVDVADGVVTPRANAINLGHLNSFAHFATNLPAATRVTITTTNGLTPEFNIIPGTGYRFNLTPAAVTATVQADGHLYVTLPNPGRISNKAITFTASNGATATLKAAALSAGNYYRAGWSADGGSEGITLEFTGGETPDYPGYENEDPRNPLHKFAKFNLTRTGDGEVTNRFVDSETENGALYQWGRNYGFEDTFGFYEGTIYDNGVNEYNNFLDALGSHVDRNGIRIFDYYVYNYDPWGSVIATGTGGKTADPAGIGMQIMVDYDQPKLYSSVNDITANPTKFFLPGFLEIEDYWATSFENGGSTWTERAKKCGYEKGNPCPDKWRLPTKDDWAEIAPETNIKGEYRESLTSLINDKPVKRKTKDGIFYVIRWTDKSTYLEIQAIVVDENTSATSIIWENNTAVVTRIFPFTGQIREERWASSSYYDIVRPTHWGETDGNPYAPMYIIGPGGCHNDEIGSYWGADGSAFIFQELFVNTKNQYKSSFLGISTNSNKANAYAIRPVMDIP